MKVAKKENLFDYGTWRISFLISLLPYLELCSCGVIVDVVLSIANDVYIGAKWNWVTYWYVQLHLIEMKFRLIQISLKSIYWF